MKAAIYLRVSSLEQNPENQKAACLAFAKLKGYEIEGIYQEQLSGFKDINRPQYEIIKQKAFRREIQAVIVWAVDRWVRNRDTFMEDITILSMYGTRLHAVQEAWIEAINMDGALGKTIREFLLSLMASLAEMESQRKSERVKSAVRRCLGKETTSYKGNKWGRKQLSTQAKNKIIEAYKNGFSIRKIANMVQHSDKNNQMKNVSIGVVHKVLTKAQEEKLIEIRSS